MPRKGPKKAILNAASNSRPGDYLRVNATLGDKITDLRLNLRANEAQGGPIAGALGYSPDRPFFATAIVNGSIVDAVVRTGDFVPLVIKGRYGENRTRIAGFADFSGSDLLAPFAERIGRTVRFGFATSTDSDRDGLHGVGWRLIADNLNASASGDIRLSDRSSPGRHHARCLDAVPDPAGRSARGGPGGVQGRVQGRRLFLDPDRLGGPAGSRGLKLPGPAHSRPAERPDAARTARSGR